MSLGTEVQEVKGYLIKAVEALNSVSMQVWAIIIVLCGVALYFAKHAEAATPVVTGGFALLQNKEKNV